MRPLLDMRGVLDWGQDNAHFSDQMIADRNFNQCGGVFNVELGEHVFAVGIDGSDIEEQGVGNLVVGLAFRDQFQNLFFPFGEHGQEIAGCILF